MAKPDKCKNTENTTGDPYYDWQHCGVCGGRVHEPDCRGKKIEGRDCFDDHTDEELKAAGYGD